MNVPLAHAAGERGTSSLPEEIFKIRLPSASMESCGACRVCGKTRAYPRPEHLDPGDRLADDRALQAARCRFHFQQFRHRTPPPRQRLTRA
jgi:hypothetical protein